MVIRHLCRTLILLLALFFLFGLRTTRAQLTPLRVGYLPVVSQLPLIVSYYKDQFKYVSVKPALTGYNSFTALEAALRVGAIDTAVVPVPIALSMAADNIPVKILGYVSRGGSLLIAKKPGDYSFLKEKVIGVPGLDTNENIFLKQALTGKRLRYGLDYKTIGLPMNSALEDLSSGVVDALYYPEPYGTIALHQGKGFAVLGQEALSGNFLYVLVMRDILLEDRHLSGLLEWLKSIVKVCEGLEEQGSTHEVENTPLVAFDKEIIEFSLKKKVGGIQFGLWPINRDKLRKNMDSLIQLKILYKSIALENLIYPSPFEKILQAEEGK